MKALEISGISFSYSQLDDKNDFQLSDYTLNDFNMSVESGEIHALLGPNGAGKTTLMRIITGSLSGYAGNIRIFGYPPKSKNALQSLGYAPQPISLFPSLTAIENLHLFGVMAGLSEKIIKEKSKEVLGQTGLSEFSSKKVSIYSGGMLRRLNLAVALLHSPRLLLLDEPTVGVDPHSRYHMYDTLKKLNNTGMTIVLCTHILDEAQRLCHKATVLDKGKIVFNGDMASIDNLEKLFLERTGHSLRDECE